MDIKEIERLHAQYSEPPLTIDMDATPAIAGIPSQALPGPMSSPDAAPAGEKSAGISSTWKLGVLFIVLAVVMYCLGSLMGSAGKRKAAEESSTATEKAMPTQASGHEWPASTAVATAPATSHEGASAPVAVEPPTPVASPKPTAAQAEQREPRLDTRPLATKPISPPAQQSRAPTPVQTQPSAATAAPARSNEIKLF